MGDRRTREFTQGAAAPAVLSVVLEAWWKIAATPGDLVDVLVATAGAGLLAGTLGGRRSPGEAARQLDGMAGGTDGLHPRTAEKPNWFAFAARQWAEREPERERLHANPEQWTDPGGPS